jgi:hypothetical protein
MNRGDIAFQVIENAMRRSDLALITNRETANAVHLLGEGEIQGREKLATSGILLWDVVEKGIEVHKYGNRYQFKTISTPRLFDW